MSTDPPPATPAPTTASTEGEAPARRASAVPWHRGVVTYIIVACIALQFLWILRVLNVELAQPALHASLGVAVARYAASAADERADLGRVYASRRITFWHGPGLRIDQGADRFSAAVADLLETNHELEYNRLPSTERENLFSITVPDIFHYAALQESRGHLLPATLMRAVLAVDGATTESNLATRVASYVLYHRYTWLGVDKSLAYVVARDAQGIARVHMAAVSDAAVKARLAARLVVPGLVLLATLLLLRLWFVSRDREQRQAATIALQAEVERKTADIRKLVGKLGEANRQVAADRDAFRAESRTDALTGLANRRRFDDALLTEWSRCRKDKLPLACILLDIDFFKLYNDHYGHGRGDQCLREIGAALADWARQKGSVLARYGGEEFIALLPGIDSPAAILAAEDLRASIEALQLPHSSSPISDHVTASVGVAALVPDAHAERKSLTLCADSALYAAKAAGRNQVGISDGSLSQTGTMTLAT